MKSFTPNADNTRAFRTALGQFGTGVTVVTVASPEGPMGITANSFAAVSLDPPLVLWSPANASKRASYYIEAADYAIHVLRADQGAVSAAFAKAPHRFHDLSYTLSDQGVPLIEGCLARFECRRHAAHEGGDHTILVGEVVNVALDAGAPLLFQNGTFGSFQPDL